MKTNRVLEVILRIVAGLLYLAPVAILAFESFTGKSQLFGPLSRGGTSATFFSRINPALVMLLLCLEVLVGACALLFSFSPRWLKFKKLVIVEALLRVTHIIIAGVIFDQFILNRLINILFSRSVAIFTFFFSEKTKCPPSGK